MGSSMREVLYPLNFRSTFFKPRKNTKIKILRLYSELGGRSAVQHLFPSLQKTLLPCPYGEQGWPMSTCNTELLGTSD